MRNYKRFYFIYILLISVICPQSYADNFGKIQVLSNINERFVAKIPMTDDADFRKLKLKIAPQSTYDTRGVIREQFMDDFNIRMLRDENSSYVKITSNKPISTEFFTILLDIDNAGKSSSYSALVDFDHPSPRVSLLFETAQLAHEDSKSVEVEVNLDKSIPQSNPEQKNSPDTDQIESLPENKMEIPIESIQEPDILQEDDIITPAKPDDVELYKSDLYQKILEESQKTSKSDVSTGKKTASLDKDFLNFPSKNVYEKQKARLQDINSSIPVYGTSSQSSVSGDEPFIVSMGNDKLSSVFASNNSNEDSFSSLSWAIIIGLFTFVIGSFYYRKRQQQALKEVHLGNFENINSVDGSSPYSKKFHRTLKNLLNDGKFDEAMKLFRYEFRYRGMSLYELCQYYETFQKYGITEFATDTFLQEILSNQEAPLSANMDESIEDIDVEPLQSQPLHQGEVRKTTNPKKDLSEKQNADLEEKLTPLDLDGVSDNDVITAKLNLATAYLNMGDHIQAVNILNDVCQNGTPQQRSEASRLLKKISH